MEQKMTTEDRLFYAVVHQKTMVWNYDNTNLFRARYFKAQPEARKHYRNTSLLFKYCKDVTPSHNIACRVFCVLGRLGILDICDLIEARNYIYEVDPSKFPPNEFPNTDKQYAIKILQLLD